MKDLLRSVVLIVILTIMLVIASNVMHGTEEKKISKEETENISASVSAEEKIKDNSPL